MICRSAYGRQGYRFGVCGFLLVLALGTLVGCQQTGGRSAVTISAEEAAQGIVGRIEWVRNRVQGIRPGKRRKLQSKRDPVVRGEWFETGEEAVIAMGFADGAQIRLSEHAGLLISNYVYDPVSKMGTADYKLSVGSMRFISGAMNQAGVKIETPSAIIGLTGSDAIISVAPAGDTAVTVFDGGFTISGIGNDSPPVTVSTNQNTMVSHDGKPSKVSVGTDLPEGWGRGDKGPPRTALTWESTPPDERDPVPRDWTRDISVLGPGGGGEAGGGGGHDDDPGDGHPGDDDDGHGDDGGGNGH